MTASLVQPLFSGPLDILGDIHGEIDALTALLGHLGYEADGRHPQDRRLVFVGDLVDRGPDSPGVVAWVRRLIEARNAQAVLGNHELNILLGTHKDDNVWFFHQSLPADDDAAKRPQVWANPHTREEMTRFFASLPLALERADLRVVHACWNNAMIDAARPATDVCALHRESRRRIDADLVRRGLTEADGKLARQNEDPVKLLTSGPEAKADRPFMAMGKMHHERRVAWWHEYEGPLCVFGHYWRITLADEIDRDRLFPNVPREATLGRGDAMCIDYSVGKRFRERLTAGFKGTYQTRLAALRMPERVLVFDDGEQCPLRDARTSGSAVAQ